MIFLIKKIAVIFLLIFLFYSLISNLFNYQKKFQFYKDYNKDYQDLLEKNKKLKMEILKNQDYYTIERNIREKLNLLRPNEVAIILPKTTPTPSPSPKPQKPVYQQWLELFSYH